MVERGAEHLRVAGDLHEPQLQAHDHRPTPDRGQQQHGRHQGDRLQRREGHQTQQQPGADGAADQRAEQRPVGEPAAQDGAEDAADAEGQQHEGDGAARQAA